MRTLALDCVRQLLLWPGLAEPQHRPVLQAVLAAFHKEAPVPLQGEQAGAGVCGCDGNEGIPLPEPRGQGLTLPPAPSLAPTDGLGDAELAGMLRSCFIYFAAPVRCSGLAWGRPVACPLVSQPLPCTSPTD